MCGIYGFFFDPASPDRMRERLSAMAGTLQHRGPDDEGTHIEPGKAALGHRRLSIIDLSPAGHQPMTSEDGNIWLTFNGEIYNYRELADDLRRKGHRFRSQTDSEVIIHLYEEKGMDLLQQLNGMFAFALWDARREEGFLARDRMGIKPLHYLHDNQGVAFASEIKALLTLPGRSGGLDMTALDQYLCFDYIPAPRTIFSRIRKLMPATWLHIRRDTVSEHTYWSTASTEPDLRKRSEASWAEEFEYLFETAVRRRLAADVPLGAFLSGGLDSSAVCAFIQKAGAEVRTFHIGFEEQSFDESRFAALTAAHLGTQHLREDLPAARMVELIPDVARYLDEPFGDPSFFPTLLLSRFTRRHVKVSLSGDGSDELFAGYPTYPAHACAALFGRLPRFLQSALAGSAAKLPVSHRNLSLDFKIKKFLAAAHDNSPASRHYRWMGAFQPEELADLFAARGTREAGTVFAPAQSRFREKAGTCVLEKLLYCDQRFYLQDNMLVKIDRASMAASLEARVPFLDHELVEFAARLPAPFKLKGFQGKLLLRTLMKRRLPQAVLRRPKKGFGIPVSSWFGRELKPLLKDLFSESGLKRQGIWNSRAIHRLLEEHWTNKADHRKKIYNLMIFQLWHQKYATMATGKPGQA